MSAATRSRLVRMLAGGPIDLAEANLLIAAEGSPGLDIDEALARLDGLALAAREAGVVPTLRSQGFRGAADDYDDPRNSFLHEVLARRRGLPIALATLTLGVAERVGVPMCGIGMPGHFVVADLSGALPVYLDPFHSWRRLDAVDCAALVRASAGLAFRSEFLRPASAREILTRTLANLRGSYMRRRRFAEALWAVELGLIVTPEDALLTRDAVALLATVGRYEEAEAAAAACLAASEDEPARLALRAQLCAIRSLRQQMN